VSAGPSGAVAVERQGRVAVVRFDRGDGNNALSFGAMEELRQCALSFDEDPDVSAIVLTGTDSVWSKGFDLKDEEARAAYAGGLADRRLAARTGTRMCKAWSELQPLTIAAVEGWCVGGGVALAASCDLRIAGSGAVFYTPEIERGMNMGWRSVPRLVRLMGPSRAKRMLALAEKLDAARAASWGLADEVVAAGTALSCALDMAGKAAGMPPVQLRMIKGQVDAAAHAFDEALSYMDGDQNLLARSGEDFQEGVDAFLEKRPPRYTGR